MKSVPVESDAYLMLTGDPAPSKRPSTADENLLPFFRWKWNWERAIGGADKNNAQFGTRYYATLPLSLGFIPVRGVAAYTVVIYHRATMGYVGLPIKTWVSDRELSCILGYWLTHIKYPRQTREDLVNDGKLGLLIKKAQIYVARESNYYSTY